MSSRYDSKWRKPFEVVKPAIDSSLLSENDNTVVKLIVRYTQFEYHLQNWAHLPKALRQRLDAMLDDVRPPQRNGEFEGVLKTLGTEIGDRIARETRQHMALQQEKVMIELNFSHIRAPYLNIYQVARKRVHLRYGRKINSKLIDECVHTALSFVAHLNPADRPRQNQTASAVDASAVDATWEEPKRTAAAAKPGAPDTTPTTTNRFEILDVESHPEPTNDDLEPETSDAATATAPPLPQRPTVKRPRGAAPVSKLPAPTTRAASRRSHSSTGSEATVDYGTGRDADDRTTPTNNNSRRRHESASPPTNPPCASPDEREPTFLETQFRYIPDKRTQEVNVARNRLPDAKLQQNQTKSPTLVIGDSNIRSWTGYPADWTVVCHAGKTAEDRAGLVLRSVHMINNVDRVVLAAGINNLNNTDAQLDANVDLLRRLQETLNGRLYVTGVVSSDRMSVQRQDRIDAINERLRAAAGTGHYIEPADPETTIFFNDDIHYSRRTGTQMVNIVQDFFRLG